jgi:hypothetical protein
MLFIDVDAMSKLAHWKILPELPSLLSTTWSETATLSALEFRARRATQSLDHKLFHAVDAAHLILDIIGNMAKPDGEPDEDILRALTDVRAIDAGEAVLLSQIVNVPGDRLLTGDKRAISALSKLSIAHRFTGKIITLEQIILACLHVHGSHWLHERICPFRHLDKMVQVALGSTCNADDANIREALNAYIKDVEREYTPTLLYKIES